MQLTTLGTFTVDVVTDEIILANHGRYDTSRVQFSSSGTLPAGLSTSTTYYCIVTSSSRFKVSLTSGGSAVDIMDAGTGTQTVLVEVDTVDKGLLTYFRELQSHEWFLSGAEKGLLTYFRELQSHEWFLSGVEKGLLTYGRNDQGPRWANRGGFQEPLTFGATPAELEANIEGSTTITAEMELVPLPGPPFNPGGSGVDTDLPLEFRCDTALKTCLPCDDDPVLNISAEDADSDRFLFNFNQRERPPLGFRFEQLGCSGWCWSENSQLDADLCAVRQVVECLNGGISFGGGGIPPFTIPQTPGLFVNTEQTCTTVCPDGTAFGWTFPAGLIVDRNQVQANRIAFSFACRLSRAQKICITTTSLPGGCVGGEYSKQLKASGGTGFRVTFQNQAALSALCQPGGVTLNQFFPYAWSIVSGSLPPGLTLSPCSGMITGTATMTGSFPIIVKAMDGIGSFQTKQFTIQIGEITNADPLPNASPFGFYLQNLATNVGDLEQQTWTVISGSLPPGFTLTESGVLSGMSDGTLASYIFTVQVIDATPGAGFICAKLFHLTVGTDYGDVVPDIFSSTVTFWNGGAALAAGTYRVSYVTGAMEYAPCFPTPCWQVNAIGAGFHVKYNGGAGDVLFPASTTAFATEPPVYADNAGKFIEFTHTGGTIGIVLVDSPFGDNVAGTPNPTFKLIGP